jgi:hypothetical protein
MWLLGDVDPLLWAEPFNKGSGTGQQMSLEMMQLNGYLVSPKGNITLLLNRK